MKKNLVLFMVFGMMINTWSLIAQTYTQSSGTNTVSNQTYSSTTEDESVVKITGGTLNLDTCTITKSGATSDSDNSNFYGLNAAVLNYGSSGVINMTGGTITTSGVGANAFYAYAGSSTISNVTINCSANSSRGLFATGGGTITAENVTATTAGSNSSVIATDRGSGTISVNGGTYICTGTDAAVIYSTGTITVDGIAGSSAQGEIAVIEGSNSVTIEGESSITSGSSERGIMALQSGSGDAEGSEAYFTITGGTLTTTNSSAPLVEVVTNATGYIYLNSVTTSIASGILMLVDYNTRWETNGSTGNLYLNGSYTYTGDIQADSYSTANTSILTGATLDGKINNANTALLTTLTMDSDSKWNVTGDSYVNGLITNPSITDDSVTNITGNGYNIYYSESTNSSLNSKTYSLVNGGYLLPDTETGISELTMQNICVYPNPTTTSLTIGNSSETGSEISFEIYSITGRLIKSNTAEYNESINVSDLATGNYLIKIINDNDEVVTKKFIKE